MSDNLDGLLSDKEIEHAVASLDLDKEPMEGVEDLAIGLPPTPRPRGGGMNGENDDEITPPHQQETEMDQTWTAPPPDEGQVDEELAQLGPMVATPDVQQQVEVVTPQYRPMANEATNVAPPPVKGGRVKFNAKNLDKMISKNMKKIAVAKRTAAELDSSGEDLTNKRRGGVFPLIQGGNGAIFIALPNGGYAQLGQTAPMAASTSGGTTHGIVEEGGAQDAIAAGAGEAASDIVTTAYDLLDDTPGATAPIVHLDADTAAVIDAALAGMARTAEMPSSGTAGAARPIVPATGALPKVPTGGIGAMSANAANVAGMREDALGLQPICPGVDTAAGSKGQLLFNGTGNTMHDTFADVQRAKRAIFFDENGHITPDRALQLEGMLSGELVAYNAAGGTGVSFNEFFHEGQRLAIAYFGEPSLQWLADMLRRISPWPNSALRDVREEEYKAGLLINAHFPGRAVNVDWAIRNVGQNNGLNVDKWKRGAAEVLPSGGFNVEIYVDQDSMERLRELRYRPAYRMARAYFYPAREKASYKRK